MVSVHPIAGPGIGIGAQNFDAVMINGTGAAITKGDVVSVKAIAAAADATPDGRWQVVKKPVDGVDDDIDDLEFGFFGVALADCANSSTATVRVRFQGYVDVKVAGTPATGDGLTVVLDTTGKVTPAATGDKVVAFYCGIDSDGDYASAADDEIVQCLFDGLNGFGMDHAT
jgi:hypothetical protein